MVDFTPEVDNLEALFESKPQLKRLYEAVSGLRAFISTVNKRDLVGQSMSARAPVRGFYKELEKKGFEFNEGEAQLRIILRYNTIIFGLDSPNALNCELTSTASLLDCGAFNALGTKSDEELSMLSAVVEKATATLSSKMNFQYQSLNTKKMAIDLDTYEKLSGAESLAVDLNCWLELLEMASTDGQRLNRLYVKSPTLIHEDHLPEHLLKKTLETLKILNSQGFKVGKKMADKIKNLLDRLRADMESQLTIRQSTPSRLTDLCRTIIGPTAFRDALADPYRYLRDMDADCADITTACDALEYYLTEGAVDSSVPGYFSNDYLDELVRVESPFLMK